MKQPKQPATITDNAAFKTLVNAWKYADIWENFKLVYQNRNDVPPRLRNYTIVRSDDPNEPFGALLQMPADSADTSDKQGLFSKKLLAKVRL